MKTRATIALAAVAGLAAMASAQEVVNVTYNWIEVNAGTTTPSTVAGLAGNSRVDAGEGARIIVSANYLINGTNGIGKTTTIPVGPGVGTTLGWGAAFIDLTGAGGDATGSWLSRQVSSVLSFGQAFGNVLNGGAQLQGVGGGQSVTPGVTRLGNDNYVANSPSSVNPLGTGTPTGGTNMMRSVWTPNSYASRTITFLAGPTAAVNPSNENMKIIIGYHTTTSTFNDPDLGDTTDTTVTFYDSLYSKAIGVNYANGVSIPIGPVPAPSSIALLGLGALVAGRRRR
jgi:hypothetical protein